MRFLPFGPCGTSPGERAAFNGTLRTPTRAGMIAELRAEAGGSYYKLQDAEVCRQLVQAVGLMSAGPTGIPAP